LSDPLPPKTASGRFKRARDRAKVDGTVWLSHKDRLVPAGRLLDLSPGGLRYRHDSSQLDAEGFPLPAPAAGQTLLLAVALHRHEPLRALHAQTLRVKPGADGAVEVACKFEASDAREMKDIHRQFVDASLQRARLSLSGTRAKLFNQPQPRRQRLSLGQVLLKRKAIAKADLDSFLDGNRTGVPLGTRLLKAGLVSSRQLAEALAEHTGVPFVDLDAVGVEDDALHKLRPSVAMQMGVVPFAIGSRRLKVAAAHALTLDEKADLEARSRMKVLVYLADQEQLERILHGPSAPKRRARQDIRTEVLVRYRFYGPHMEQLDHRTFEGAAANLSETGILFNGPVPQPIVEAFKKGPPPRTIVAVQIFHGEAVAPVTLRFEPMRISPVPLPNRVVPPSPEPTQMCWVGARISPVLGEDRKHLLKLCEEIR